MKLICPKCHQRQIVTPKALLGRYFVCRHCRGVVPWDETIYVEGQNEAVDENEDDGADTPTCGANGTFLIP